MCTEYLLVVGKGWKLLDVLFVAKVSCAIISCVLESPEQINRLTIERHTASTTVIKRFAEGRQEHGTQVGRRRLVAALAIEC